MELSRLIEAILFAKAEPVARTYLVKVTGKSAGEIDEAIAELSVRLKDTSGLELVTKDNEVTLGTSPEAAEILKSIREEELSKDLGKAGLETLSIVLYRGPIAKPDIDYIRGVNSGFVLRHLSVRGLVERIPNPKDARTFLYRPTFKLLSHLGLSKVEDLPEYTNIQEEIETHKNNQPSDNE